MDISKHRQGTVSELLAASHFIRNNCKVLLPVDGFSEYDLVIDTEAGLKKVQVKTVYWDNSKNRSLISCVTSHVRGNSRRTNKKYTSESFDILAAIHEPTMKIYKIPVSEITGRRSITVYPYGKPKTVSSRYQDYEQYVEQL